MLRKTLAPPLRGPLREARTVDAAARRWKLLLALAVLRWAWRGARWIGRHWLLAALATAAVWLWTAAGWWPFAAASVSLAAWGAASPASFARRVFWPLRAAWRRRAVYARWWEPLMVRAGLAAEDRPPTMPRLRSVTSAPDVDVLRVRLAPGQTVEQWTAAAPALRATFRLLDCRPRSGRPGEVELHCVTADPLRRPIACFSPPTDQVDLSAVLVGRRDDGTDLRLPLWRPGRGATHWLIGGETGAGKGSVLWSLLAGVAPLIGTGQVRVWGADPKGGMELGAAAPLFTRLVWGEPSAEGEAWQTPLIVLLEDAVRGMQLRAARLRSDGDRVHTPTADDPLTIVVVDELAALTAYITEPTLRRRAADALSLLLSQGRAPGVAVVAASQDVRKETVGMRDLFPGRIALRTAEPGMADMILGKGARDRGAQTDRIPASTPGVGYVVLEDSPEPVRARFAYATDADLRDLSARWEAPPLPGQKKVGCAND
jgi:S-DNA-T family DNA segregation ATPase FtsK/SpoIIIE